MKNNIKLFFTSLINNNACIDGGRKKPWYTAIIMFLVSMILSVIPTTVLELKKQGDKNFDSNTYMAAEALTEFSEYIADKNIYVLKEEKTSTLITDESINYDHFNLGYNKVDYKFRYSSNENAEATRAVLTEEKVSFFLFTPDTLYIYVLAPEDNSKAVVSMMCINAYKKIGENDFKGALSVGETKSDTINQTWSNWKGLVKNLYNQTRLKAAGIQLGIMSAVNAGIILVMGFMVWVLTRGKNNPYRIFNVWECYKIVFWAGLTPAILTSGLGFLIKTFASTIFPLLLGVRVMWLSMKSLRPDGSGYANN